MSHNLGPVKQWSFSRLSNYEECPHRVYLSAVERRPGPARGEDHPAERGTRIHTACERYVKDEGPLVKEMRRFETDFESLKEHYNDGHVQLEGDWGFDIDWQQTGWWDDNVWARIKLDAFRRYDERTAGLIDYKTGKKMGNEVKHMQQMQLYAVGAFMRYPEIEMIDAEFWYFDHGPALQENLQARQPRPLPQEIQPARTRAHNRGELPGQAKQDELSLV